jgi:5-methylthioadenosine/S-adenosylhomocysteine deaminase
MLLGGITCFADMYYYPEVAGTVAAELGIRAVVGMIVLEARTAWAADADEYLRKGLEVHDRFKAEPLITTAFAPHAPYSVTDATLTHVRRLADELDLPIHTHLHETRAEVDAEVAASGRRPFERLAALGLVTPSLIGVHATQLVAGEIAALATAGASVVHCPRSNLKLASGICPVQPLLDAGVNVALGTDGAASSSSLDLWAELRTAALLAKQASGDAAALPASQALAIATLNGARALGLGAEIGSLVAGKSADVICVDLSGIEHRPLLDPVATLVYAASRHDVTDVWVAGEHLVADRSPLRFDVAEVGNIADRWGRQMRAET